MTYPQSHGQCRISTNSTTQIFLNPYNGNGLVIAGVMQSVPPLNTLSITNSGLVPNMLYYIFAWMNGGTMALQPFPLIANGKLANGHSTSASAGNVGIEILSGNDSFTLVGMTQTDGTGAFIPANGLTCGTINWFNRRTAYCSTGGGLSTATSPGFVNLGPQFLAKFTVPTNQGLACVKWSDSAVIFGANGFGQASAKGNRIGLCVSDTYFGTTNLFAGVYASAAFDSQSVNLNTQTSGINGSEGLHYFSIFGCAPDGGQSDFFVVPYVWLEF